MVKEVSAGPIAHQFDTTYDVDTTDRLKYTYTVWLLVALGALVFAANYVGEPMQCWVPNQFEGGWESYAETYCLIEGTYHVNMNDSNLPEVEERANRQIGYYQWVPFILALNALFIYAPRMVWKMLLKYQDISLGSVTCAARENAKSNLGQDTPTVTPETAEKRWRFGTRLTFSLIFTKILSMVMLICQLMVLEWFISGHIFSFFGLSVVADLIRGRRWKESGSFPRVTFCDFEVRELGQVQRWSLQCVLMVNMFNEKIFIFVWWLFVFLLVAASLNLVKWTIRLSNSRQNQFIDRVANCFDESVSVNRINEFRKEVLKTDGVTLLWLIEENATLYQATEFVQPLWNKFNGISAEKKNM